MSGFIRIRVDDNGVLAGLQKSESLVTKEANRELREVVRSTTLPKARVLAPHQSGRFAGRMRAGASGNRAFLENKSPYAGLLEFGGTRHDVIRAKPGSALLTPAGPRSRVSGPRTYTGQHKMAAAISLTSKEVLEAQLDAIARAIASVTGGSLT